MLFILFPANTSNGLIISEKSGSETFLYSCFPLKQNRIQEQPLLTQMQGTSIFTTLKKPSQL